MKRLRTGNKVNCSNQGSALITAIIFTTVLSVVAITYLDLSNAAMRDSNRAYYNMAAFNLAESGLEHGVQALRQNVNGNLSWKDWVC